MRARMIKHTAGRVHKPRCGAKKEGYCNCGSWGKKNITIPYPYRDAICAHVPLSVLLGYYGRGERGFELLEKKDPSLSPAQAKFISKVRKWRKKKGIELLKKAKLIYQGV